MIIMTLFNLRDILALVNSGLENVNLDIVDWQDGNQESKTELIENVKATRFAYNWRVEST